MTDTGQIDGGSLLPFRLFYTSWVEMVDVASKCRFFLKSETLSLCTSTHPYWRKIEGVVCVLDYGLR